MKRQTIELYNPLGQRKYVTSSERKRFLEAAKTMAFEKRLFCLVLLYTGCRISEALQFTSVRIDAQQKLLVFRTLKRRREHQRAVPVPVFLIKELSQIVPDEETDRLWVFSRRSGWKIVKNAMTIAGIEGAQSSAKGLRHGFGIVCAENNIPISLIAQWLGHASISTTIIYLNAVGKEEQKFAKRTWIY